MKKSIKKSYLFLALFLILLSFAPIISVNAWGRREKVTYRPLSDWTLNNPRVVYGFTTNWDLLPEGYLVRPLIESPDQYCGYITEKLLDEGCVEVMVYIFVKNCEIILWGLQDAFDGVPQDLLVDTSYTCFYIQKFFLLEAGMEIPSFFDIYIAGQWILSYSIGLGSGTFTEYAVKFGFTPGATGRVFLHQMGYISSEGEEIWPYEDIKIFE